ncbi:hypothetical protein ACQP2Y_03115 [Actinoplanes sp. CA-051413]|uniref:hypothetical protein n=1 Tax=Actinoplanes sp. CA-051413 TaxID=3239899 RepID=UPI003D96B2A4
MRGALIAVGAIVMGYAVLGAATDPDLKPGGVLLFLAAVLVAHDAVLLPATIAGGAIIGRFAPRRFLPGIRAAAIISIAVGVVALPLVFGYGRSADNPSVLPLAYGRGLLLVLAVTWAAALVSTGLVRHRAGTTKGDRPRPAQAPRAPSHHLADSPGALSTSMCVPSSESAEEPSTPSSGPAKEPSTPSQPAEGPSSLPPPPAEDPRPSPPQPSEGQQ